MFDGRFDQHFAEVFASSPAGGEAGEKTGWAFAICLGASLAVLVAACVVGLA